MEEENVKKKMLYLGAAAWLSSAAGVQAADVNLGRNLAASCANCHGTDGRSVGGIPELAGMSKGKMLGLLNEFRSGAKPATIMHQISRGYTDEQLALIAEYFASRTAQGGGK
jgi:cytochrome subunit of sulfide dehydrogenase